MTSRPANTVERKIYFFRADVGVDDGGVPLTFDPQPALQVIDSLLFTNDDSGRYHFDVDGNAVCLVGHSGAPSHSVRFCRVRRTGLPQLEQGGNISDLNLSPDTGLLEAVHVVFFPDKVAGANIVGAEYNHFGPRISRLSSYLYEKSNEAVPYPTFRPLIRDDAAEQLDRLTEIRVLDISVHPSFADVMRQADQSLGDAFEANARVVDEPESVQVVVKPQRQARQSTLERLVGPLRSLLNQNDARPAFDRLQIRGRCDDTGRVETIDLLKDQLISTKQIVRLNERGRALDPDSAFQAIRDSYQELGDSLQLATGVSP